MQVELWWLRKHSGNLVTLLCLSPLSSMPPSCLGQGLRYADNTHDSLRQPKLKNSGEEGVRNRKPIFQIWWKKTDIKYLVPLYPYFQTGYFKYRLAKYSCYPYLAGTTSYRKGIDFSSRRNNGAQVQGRSSNGAQSPWRRERGKAAIPGWCTSPTQTKVGYLQHLALLLWSLLQAFLLQKLISFHQGEKSGGRSFPKHISNNPVYPYVLLLKEWSSAMSPHTVSYSRTRTTCILCYGLRAVGTRHGALGVQHIQPENWLSHLAKR